MFLLIIYKENKYLIIKKIYYKNFLFIFLFIKLKSKLKIFFIFILKI